MLAVLKVHFDNTDIPQQLQEENTNPSPFQKT